MQSRLIEHYMNFGLELLEMSTVEIYAEKTFRSNFQGSSILLIKLYR